jgi:7-cyano-7-deazaguanine synthase
LVVRLVLFLDYGQRALVRERAAVVDIVGYYGLPLQEVDVTWLRDLAPPGMRGLAEPAPDEQEAGPLESLDDVWIPNRNGVFVNVAAAFAESYGCDEIVTGFNREEAVEFPDNSPEYVAAINRCLEYSTRSGVRVASYTADLTKREIIRKGIELSAPLGAIWSCYRGGERMCGDCGSCRRLKTAIATLPDDDQPPFAFER